MHFPKIERTNGFFERLTLRLKLLRRTASIAGNVAFIGFMANTVGRLERAGFNKKKAKGETIWIDNVFAPPADAESYARYPDVSADTRPNTEAKSRKAKVMKIEEYPDVDYPFDFKEIPVSGNAINGLGETDTSRTEHPPFFVLDGPWNKLVRYFQSINETRLANLVLKIFWMDRNRLGLIAKEQRVVEDPTQMAKEIKQLAKKCGADVVGITRLKDEMRYKDFNEPFKYAISVAFKMDRDLMLELPTPATSYHIQDAYKDVGQVAIDVATAIRAMGWPARASTNISPDSYEVLHIRVAVEAGVGTLGKHGSLITKDFGSGVRLATVLTDLPLVEDGLKDIGVDDFCASCQICTNNCPPHAIFDEKQTVRGNEKWYVNFDKCVPYFVEHDNCGICIEVCPWSEPGRGNSIMRKMLAQRESKTLDD